MNADTAGDHGRLIGIDQQFLRRHVVVQDAVRDLADDSVSLSGC